MLFGLSRREVLTGGVALTAVSLLDRQAGAQARGEAWRPTKSVRIVCGYPAGGAIDAFARILAEFMSKNLGQPVVVENKVGAGGSLAAIEVKRAAPDGHTLLCVTATTMVMNKVLYKNLQYDPDRDFDLISYVLAAGLPLIVSTQTGCQNLSEFVAFARKEKTNVGTYGPGSFAHMCIAELNKLYGLQIEPVHYRGEAPMFTDVASGSIQGGIGGAVAGMNVISSGRGRALAVLSKKRLSKMPDVPTFVELGANSRFFSLMGYACIAAPANLPSEIAEAYSQLCVAAGNDVQARQRIEAAGIEDPPMDRQDFMRMQRDEAPIWLEHLSSLGLTPE